MFRSYKDAVRKPVVCTEPKPKFCKQYKCELCKAGPWLSETDVEIHRKSSHKRAIYKLMKQNLHRFCTVCMRLQDSPECLIQHIKSQHLFSSSSARRIEREIFICDHCKNVFFNKDLFTIHIKRSHMVPVKNRATYWVPCPVCKKDIRLKLLWFHFLFHEIPSLSNCPICLYNCEDTSELSRHLFKHQKHYFCDTCQFKAISDQTLDGHLNGHSRQCQDRYDVDVEKYFLSTSKDPVHYHRRSALKGLKLPSCIQICILCREICIGPDEMRAHLVKDHFNVVNIQEKKKTYGCICGEVFSNNILLKHHLFKLKVGHRALGVNEVAVASTTVDIHNVTNYEDVITNSKPQ